MVMGVGNDGQGNAAFDGYRGSVNIVLTALSWFGKRTQRHHKNKWAGEALLRSAEIYVAYKRDFTAMTNPIANRSGSCVPKE